MKTKKVKLNIVMVVKASKYFADQLKDNAILERHDASDLD